MTKVLLGMSGGIDSSMAAVILKEQGYEVEGITMSVWKQDVKFRGKEGANSCFSANKQEDINKTMEICGKIGIKHSVLDISDLYESVVLRNFREEYLGGRTPNPCIWCNQKIKFGAMVDYARESGIEFDFFATGHYARIERINGRYALLKGIDPVKDQSYFLYRLSQKQLATTLFPLGNLRKEDVKQRDFELGFHDINQTESQDFYSGHYTELLDVNPMEGDIVDLNGKVLGKHQGMWNYTIGQRKGLGIAYEKPLYVVGLDPVKNQVIVGLEEHTVNRKVTADRVVWGAVDNIEGRRHLQAKIRSTGSAVDCMVYMDENDRLTAEFDNPVKAATCGQSLVIYENDMILCGGIISSVDQ